MHRYDLDETDSTNTRAAERLRKHTGETVLVTAVTQTAGRGRWGRSWQSPAGGAWFSLGVTLPRVNELVSIDAAHAVRDALSGWVDAERMTIKPPNDVLLDGKKVAGILCEQTVAAAEASSDGGRVKPAPVWLVVGVGVNVSVDVAALGDDLRWPAVSLSEVLGEDVPVSEVVDACVSALLARLGVESAA